MSHVDSAGMSHAFRSHLASHTEEGVSHLFGLHGVVTSLVTVRLLMPDQWR